MMTTHGRPQWLNKIVKKIRWTFKPFGRGLGWKVLVKWWVIFMFAGFATFGIIQGFAKYDISEADTLTSETGVGCDRIAMMLLLLMPPVEEMLFRIAPYRYIGRNASFAGSMLWAGLHLFGRNFAVVGFQTVMGIFYFKLVASERYVESILFHEAFNLIPLLTCFMF